MNVNKPVPTKRVYVIGLGYVGLTLTAHLIKNGQDIIGVEINAATIEMIRKNGTHFHEPGLSKIINEALLDGSFEIVESLNSPQTKASSKNIFIITVGTPIDSNKKVVISHIVRACEQIGRILKPQDLVVLRSTVRVGTTLEVVRPLLEEYCRDFELAFCPERTAEGQALNELESLPQIIGADDDLSRQSAQAFFSRFSNEIVSTDSSKTAEMIKLVDNMQRDTTFAISNHVAELCIKLGIRTSDVINLGKKGFPRTNLPNPGPVGGPCLEKDTYILTQSVSPSKQNYLSLVARETNENLIASATLFLKSFWAKTRRRDISKVAVLGLAFKGNPETDDMRGSPALKVLEELRKNFPGVEVVGWDPLISADVLPKQLKAPNSIESALNDSDLVLILNNHRYFSEFGLRKIALSSSSDCVIYDFWDRFSEGEISDLKSDYFAWGYHV